MLLEGDAGVMYRVRECGMGENRESLNISSGLQRTAEGLESFQVALQQKQAVAGRRAHSWDSPVCLTRRKLHEVGSSLSAAEGLTFLCDLEQRCGVIYADAGNTRTA